MKLMRVAFGNSNLSAFSQRNTRLRSHQSLSNLKESKLKKPQTCIYHRLNKLLRLFQMAKPILEMAITLSNRPHMANVGPRTCSPQGVHLNKQHLLTGYWRSLTPPTWRNWFSKHNLQNQKGLTPNCSTMFEPIPCRNKVHLRFGNVRHWIGGKWGFSNDW